MTMHPLFAGILASTIPSPSIAVINRNDLLSDLADFLFIAGNQLCDDDHETLAGMAGVLLKRIESEIGRN